MKLTKKQLSALQRIVGREQTRYDETQSEALAGVHPSEKHFAITDGTMVVDRKSTRLNSSHRT